MSRHPRTPVCASPLPTTPIKFPLKTCAAVLRLALLVASGASRLGGTAAGNDQTWGLRDAEVLRCQGVPGPAQCPKFLSFLLFVLSCLQGFRMVLDRYQDVCSCGLLSCTKTILHTLFLDAGGSAPLT